MNAKEVVREKGIIEAARQPIDASVKSRKCSIQLNETRIRNQKKSGRCWIEAGLGYLEYQYYKKHGKELSELSSGYLAYHDLRQKALAFMNQIASTKHMPLAHPQINHWLAKPVQDAGQWELFHNLIERYGVMPKKYMPSSVIHNDTRTLLAGLNQKLRHCAIMIRENKTSPETLIGDIDTILDICLGIPPASFTFEGKETTPLDFYQSVLKPQMDEDYVSFINVPEQSMPFFREYGIKWLYSERKDGNCIRHINVPIDIMKQMVIAQLKEGFPVWIGLDGEHFANREKGIFDTASHNFSTLFGLSFDIDKGRAAIYKDSLLSHAMLLWGVDMKAEMIDHWCAKNSFGSNCGQDGYVYLSTEWFDRYVYQAVIPKSIAKCFVPIESIEKTPVLWLESWHAIGCLA